jgi:Tol biopolymer transport system component
MKTLLYLGIVAILFGACTNYVPDEFSSSNNVPKIYPDYTNLTIPYNIAPLNFRIEEVADDYVTTIYSTKGEKIITTGKNINIRLKNWRKLLDENKGAALYVDIYLKRNGKWQKFQFRDTISPEPIDEYISYRLIEPSYELYANMSINQRNLTNFDERKIYSSALQNQCMNCHSYQNYNKTGNMQLHLRGTQGGTIITKNGKLEKVNLKTDKIPKGAVYPSWHPTQNLIAYSTNAIGQSFHSKDNQKVEVMDTQSDLILYDVDKNEVKYIIQTNDSLETFPYWAPDGKALYFVSAYFKPTTDDTYTYIATNYKDIKYNIRKMSFDPETYTFGQIQNVYEASAIGKSATFPRVSPDGKYLLFTMADYGNFHIWHKSSDLYLMDIKTNKVRNFSEINSPDVESYHSWSSNGRWILFSSRRDDGSYTRLYITYFDKNGKAHKPFILPQNETSFYEQLFKSYNIPEFMVSPVKYSIHDFAISKPAKNVVFAGDTIK